VVDVDTDNNPDKILDLEVYVENIDGLGKGDAADLEKAGIANVGDLLKHTEAEVFDIVGQNGLDAILEWITPGGASLNP
jgi:nucleotidyltransferase/DNA polymerase involved in DNA repair